MKFSAKSEYALRALIDMTGYYGQGPIGVREIAARQGIPERFLEQQITALRKAGLVKSQRGAQGGVTLAREPESITVLEIIEALEGPLAVVTCAGNNASDCARNAQCAVQDLWCQVGWAVERVLKGTTLKQLVMRQVRYDESLRPMYYI
ncbi:MAG: Rrf2 family transcriptional regulator [Actinobacteria bacterium]|nr:Rrf2 family transcriptional regulator [Actinomycetota bacterium]